MSFEYNLFYYKAKVIPFIYCDKLSYSLRNASSFSFKVSKVLTGNLKLEKKNKERQKNNS